MKIFNRLAAAAQTLVRGPVPFSRWLNGVSAGRRGGPSEPSNEVVPVRTCVEYIAKAVGSMPFRVSTPDDQVIETGPIARLAQRPNDKQGIVEFWTDAVAFSLLFGRCHFLIEGTTIHDLQVRVINPLLMDPVIGGGELLGWDYTPRSGPKIRLDLDEVHTVVQPDYHNPRESWRGVSPCRAAEMAIRQYYKSDVANESSLDNDVQPAGAVSTEQNLTEPQERALRSQLQAEHAGSRNRRKIMLLQGGLTWQSMSASFSEMEFMKGRAFSREDICASFGLKAILFFSQSGAGMNDDQAKAASIHAHENVVRPLARRLAEEYTCAVLDRLRSDRSLTLRHGMRGEWKMRQMTGGQRRSKAYAQSRDAALAQERIALAWFDDTGEAVTIQSFLDQAEAARTWNSIGVPLNQILDATAAPFEKLASGDVPRIAVGMVDARETDTSPGSTDPDGSLPTPELVDPTPDPGSGSESAGKKSSERSAFRGLTEAQLAATWQILRAQSAAVERQFIGPYSSHLMKLRVEVLANVKRLDPGRPEIDRVAGIKTVNLHFVDDQGRPQREIVRLSRQQRDLLGELLFDLRLATDGRWKIVGKYLKAGIQAGGEQSMAEAAAGEGSPKASLFNLADPDVADAMTSRKFAIAGLTNDQRDRLRVVMARGLAAGKTTRELAEIVRTQFNIEGRRAKTVAFQESGVAVEQGRQLGRQQAGVPMKSWLWSRKETGRKSHGRTETATLETPVPVDQDFTIAGTSITCPHPRATGFAEHDINCGCTTISRYPGDRVRDLAVLRFVAGLAPKEPPPL